jgi:hypothetical protein
MCTFTTFGYQSITDTELWSSKYDTVQSCMRIPMGQDDDAPSSYLKSVGSGTC